MQLIEVQETEKDQYNQFIAASPSGSFLQSWEWGMWQTALGRQVIRLKILDDSGQQVGAVQFIKMLLWGKKHYVYSPYGPVVESEQWLVVSGKLVEQLRQKFPSAIFFRIEPQKQLEGIGQLAIKSTNIQPGITIVLDVNKSDEELLAGMHHKTRYNIKLAQKHGVTVQSELVVTPGYGLYAREALDLILQTQVRQHYHGHTEEYYQKLINFFGIENPKSDLKLIIFKALFGKELLASGVMIDFGPTRMYLYGGSSEQNRQLMAPYLLHWQAITDARQSGIKYYDFGGSEVSSGGERGFTRFKQGFGGTVVNYAGAYDVINNKTQYKIYSLVRALNKFRKKISSD
jgi:peptidoglycan pentaglycine glycine transferase (the first glycine)